MSQKKKIAIIIILIIILILLIAFTIWCSLVGFNIFPVKKSNGTWTLNGEVINITLDDGFKYTSTSGKWVGSPKTAVRTVAAQTSSQTTPAQTTATLNEGQFIRIKNLMRVIK